MQRSDTLPATPHQRGAALEELLNWQHNIYRNAARALVWHNGTRGEIHGGRAVLVKSRPDYDGILTSMAGRHVSFDAKVTASWTYHHDRKRLHQLVDLFDVGRAGGLAFLLVSLDLERFFLVWSDSSWVDPKNYHVDLRRIAIGENRIGIEVPVGVEYKLPDWLTALESFLS